MKLNRHAFGLAILSVAWTAPVAAQVFDHLKCYRIKDPVKLQAFVDLNSPQFGLEAGCKVSRATLFCVPVEKTVLSAVDKATGLPITPLPVTGPSPGDRICYTVKCRTPGPTSQQVTDQFGTRTLTETRPLRGFTANLLCAPAVKGGPPTTTTTTTTSSTTTGTTLLCVATSGTFCDLGNGTVFDAATGLQWEKKDTAFGSGVNAADLHDVDNLYSWAGLCTINTDLLCQPNAAATTTCAAQSGGALGCGECGVGDGTCKVDFFATGTITTIWDWINGVNAANFAGHGDWRLPSEDGRNGPPFNCSTCNPRELETILLAPDPCGTSPCIASIFGPTAYNYWSTTTYVTTPNVEWHVDFSNGFVEPVIRGDGNYVRAVRAGL